MQKYIQYTALIITLFNLNNYVISSLHKEYKYSKKKQAFLYIFQKEKSKHLKRNPYRKREN